MIRCLIVNEMIDNLMRTGYPIFGTGHPEGATMKELGEQERRQRRLDLAGRFAQEVSTWSSQKLRMAYAQPDAVRRAEERERQEQQSMRAKPARD